MAQLRHTPRHPTESWQEHPCSGRAENRVEKGDKDTKLQIAKELNEIAKIIIELHYQEKQGKTP